MKRIEARIDAELTQIDALAGRDCPFASIHPPPKSEAFRGWVN